MRLEKLKFTERDMKKLRILGMFFLVAFVFVVTSTNAAIWTTISGRVLTQTATPVCAMVLANGQHMFSCGGAGNYDLYVPLDRDGLITLQVFASGFAPFKQTLTAGQAVDYNVYMDRDTSGRAFTITYNEFPSSRPGWMFVSGNIDYSGTTLCAMILINGQSMFSCNQDLGRFSLEVPLDSSGNITLQAFAGGFMPFRTTIAANHTATGVWRGTFTESGFGTADLTGLMINGELYFISNGAGKVYAGTYSVNGSSITGNADLFTINGSKFGVASLSGTVVSGKTIRGSFNTSHGSSGTVSLTYDPVTNRGSSYSITNDVWSLTDDGYTLTLAINITGTIAGTDSASCVYNGQGSIIDPSKNIYRVITSITSCGAFNGSYSGFGVVSDTASTNDTLTYVVNNSNYLLFGSLTRQ